MGCIKKRVMWEECPEKRECGVDADGDAHFLVLMFEKCFQNERIRWFCREKDKSSDGWAK
jgi:hypothetical protein